MDLEGSLVAKKLNEMGVATFVLKSRLARAPGSKYSVDVESLADAQRASDWFAAGQRSGMSIPQEWGSWDSRRAENWRRWPRRVFSQAIRRE